MTKIDDTIKDIQNLGAQNAAAGKHWDKAVRYARIINKLKSERDAARKEVAQLKEQLADLEGLIEDARQMRLEEDLLD